MTSSFLDSDLKRNIFGSILQALLAYHLCLRSYGGGSQSAPFPPPCQSYKISLEGTEEGGVGEGRGGGNSDGDKLHENDLNE